MAAGRSARTAQHRRRGGVRGLERRRRRGQRCARAPRCHLGSRSDRGDRRRGLLRLPGESPGHPPGRRGHPGAGVAGDADLALSPARQRPRRRVDARGGAQHALAHVLRRAAGHRRQAQRRHRRDSGGAAGRHAAHPAGAGLGRGLLLGVGAALRAGGNPLRGPDRDRRGFPGRLRGGRDPGGDVLGGGAALRVTPTEPEGDGGAAAPRRRRARHRGSAGRLARAGRGVGAARSAR